MAPEMQQQPFSNERAGRAMQKVVLALKADRPEIAVREFMQVVSSGIAPRGVHMAPWIVSVIGKSAASGLVEAFVHFPCFYCRKGRISCETCKGRGHTERTLLCEVCLGMRLQRCDFCNGSGWVTINYVPDGLKPLVIRSRTTLAIRRMKVILDQPLPRTASPDPEATIRQAGLMILDMDRHMGVFENMLLALRNLPPAWRKSRATLDPLFRTYLHLAAKAEERLCELIRVIAACHRRLAQAMNPSHKSRRRLEEHAQYYDALVDPEKSLAGTGLTHPFLHNEINKLKRRA